MLAPSSAFPAQQVRSPLCSFFSGKQVVLERYFNLEDFSVSSQAKWSGFTVLFCLHGHRSQEGGKWQTGIFPLVVTAKLQALFVG